ncbi:hypothetical protein FRD01_11890 [Microvenator marinus]|uniref:Uncharacterized protein n=1 Tax=Microvenator marinus TaxID=2600177 RepID=A0A5B8XQX8_9DELT|nr:hypothetical protein [Microvenator marinus]QED27924.1 hypothetical protein FRD01_11890 [Microvenator marinus]
MNLIGARLGKLLHIVGFFMVLGCVDSESVIQIPEPIEYHSQNADTYFKPGKSLRPPPTTNAEDFPDTKLWITERECSPETISWNMKQGPFEIVERPSDRAHMTASEFIASGPAITSSIYQVSMIVPHPKHQAGLGSDGQFQSHILYSNHGDDVEISTYHWAPTSFGKLGELGYTVLVNFRPTSTTHRLWDDSRSEILKEVQDSGWTFSRRANVHIVDLNIGADNFDEPGAYDVTVFMNYHVDHRVNNQHVSRFTVLYGGYSLKKEVCVREALEEPITDFEREMGRNTQWLIGAFERDSGSTRYATTHPDGGVWVDWSLFRLWIDKPRIVALIPLVDARPAAEPIYTWSGGDKGVGNNSITEILEMVDDRGSFWVDIEGREKKDVMMMAIPDPFLPRRNLDGDVFYENGAYGNRHSNILSISSFRDDSDRCDAQEGPCIEWGY